MPGPTGWWAAQDDPAWLAHYWNSVDLPIRDAIVEAVADLAPFQSLTELGCHCGPNLRRLSARWPAARYYGIDANAAALKYAERHADAFAAPVQFTRSLCFGQDQPMWLLADVLLSCYALAYVAPLMLGRILSASRPGVGLVIAEPHGHGELDARLLPWGETSVAEWHHDYHAEVTRLWPDATVTERIIAPHDGITSILVVRL